MPNYYDMSGEPAAASAQPTTGADNGPTAEETIGATTTTTGTTQEQEDVQRLHKYKLPPPFFTGDYSQYEEWLFKLQAYLGLIDRDFDMVLQLAHAATRQIEDADIRAHIRDPTQAAKAVDLSRDLHYILINICQGAAATVVRQNRYNANGCETLRLLHNRFSLPVGTRSVGYLTKLLEPTFNEAQFEEQFLQWEYDINRYEKDNGIVLSDGVKIAILLNKTKGALQQHLQLRAGQITNYNEIRVVILDYNKTISAFSRASSAVGANYNGGTAPMDVDNIWRKGRNYKGKGKYAGKGHYKGNKGKGKYRSKGHYKGFDKGSKGNYNKGGYNKSKGKGYSGSKGYGSSKGYKGQGNNSKSKGKGNYNHTTCHRCGKPGHWAQDCRVPVWHIHPIENEQADHDNNEELPQDVNDTWDCEGEEGQHEVNYMEENRNDYDYDNSWDWNDNSYEGTANYIGGINESHLTIGHIRQANSRLHKHKSKSLLGKRPTHTTSWNDHSKSFQQFLQEDNSQLHFDIAAARQPQRNKKIEDTNYIMYSNFKSYHHLLIDSGAPTHVCPKGYAPDLPLRPCGESVSQLYTVTNKKIPVYGIKYVPYKQGNFRIMIPYYVCDVKYPILSASRLLDRGYGLDFTPRHCTITHGQQQAHLIRHSGLFYLRAEKIDIPTGKQYNNKNKSHHSPTQTKDYDRSLVETLTTGNLMVTTPPEYTNDHAKHYSHHTTAAAQYLKEN